MKFKIAALVIGLASLVGLSALPVAPAYAAPADEMEKSLDLVNPSDTGQPDRTLEQYVETIINALLFVIGAVSVIMIIIGGIRYTTSNGDPAKVKASKDTILYAIIGVIVAILAFAIVKWVVAAFKPGA